MLLRFNGLFNLLQAVHVDITIARASAKAVLCGISNGQIVVERIALIRKSLLTGSPAVNY